MPWFRDEYIESVWAASGLRPNEKLVALTYGQFVGAPKPKPDSDVSWVVWRVLSERTGIRSKTTLSKVTQSLEEKGWLVEVEGRRQHKSPRYRLVVPAIPEVRFVDVCGDGEQASEVQDLDNKPAPVNEPRGPETEQLGVPEVHELAPEVQEMTARGPETGPDFSNNKPPTQNTNISKRQPQDAPVCNHPHWTADGDCVKCGHHEPCPDCRRLARINSTIRCYQHQDHQEAS